MKKAIWVYNLIYYFLFKWKIVVRNLFNSINPIAKYWNWNLERVEDTELKAKLNTMNTYSNPNDTMYNNLTIGGNQNSSSITMCGLLVLFLFGCANIIEGLLNKWFNFPINTGTTQILFIIVISVLLNYFLLLKDNKYLIYFKEFDKLSNYKKNRYGWMCFSLIVLSLLLVCVSFSFL